MLNTFFDKLENRAMQILVYSFNRNRYSTKHYRQEQVYVAVILIRRFVLFAARVTFEFFIIYFFERDGSSLLSERTPEYD